MDEESDHTVQLTEGSLHSQAGCPSRYQIKHILGQGGMGLVFLAYDTELSRDVAIKVLLFEGVREKEAQERFLREAKALFALDHPNIVHIFSSGINEHGNPYNVMEYLEGETLSHELDRAPLLQDVFMLCMMQVLDALKHAHSLKIVHRDLKPSNIMHCKDGNGKDKYKIIDFGIAKFDLSLEQATKTLTCTDAVLGSPAYISPEQCRGGRGDALSDIYSMGCIMYECITGSVPFAGDNAFDTMYKHMNAEAPSLINEAKSPQAKSLARLISRCLAKSPQERPQSVDEMEAQLKEIFSSGRKIELFAGVRRRHNKELWLAIGIVSAVLILGGSGIAFFLECKQKEMKVLLKVPTKEELFYKALDKLKAKDRKSLRDYLALGRMQLESTSKKDIADAKATYSQALNLCKSDGSVLSDHRALCYAMIAKSEWMLGGYEESSADFEKAIKIVKEKKNEESAEMNADIMLERILLKLHLNKFDECFDDYLVFGLRFQSNRDFSGIVGKISGLSQHLDPSGIDRREMMSKITKEIQKIRPRDEKETASLVRFNNRIALGLIRAYSYADAKSALSYSSELLKRLNGHDDLRTEVKEHLALCKWSKRL